MADNRLDVLTISKLIVELNESGRHFYIPDYQRGYRWGETQVKALLDDIFDFLQNNENNSTCYCLQPVVVLPQTINDKECWEVIDGQQRLTTLFIIMSYLNKQIYDIEFQTRVDSQDFLNNKLTGISDKEDKTNIDYFHISRSYITIKNWFNNKLADYPEVKEELAFKLLKKVQFIWYEILEENPDPIKIFTRLNIGKIKLTDSELIKALFLKEENFRSYHGDDIEYNSKITYQKKLRIASEWDSIEQGLHDDVFWAFINQEKNDTDNRIDLLFKFYYINQERKEPGELEVFSYFYTLFDLKDDDYRDSEKVWKEIKKIYQTLQEWYKDRILYHLIGYIIHIGLLSINEVHKLSIDKRKKEFIDTLKEQIVKLFLTKRFDLYSLTYESNSDKKKLEKFFLLFNIITLLKNKESFERISFHQMKVNKWSLEHIHAQNSEGLKTENMRSNWLKDHLHVLERRQKTKKDLIIEIKKLLGSKNIDDNSFNSMYQKVLKEFIYPDDEKFEMHDISNLALLDCQSNCSLNNSVFEVKREKILELDRNGRYILPGTRFVFLKYYTDNPLHMSYWTKNDREQYVEKIVSYTNSFFEGLYKVGKDD